MKETVKHESGIEPHPVANLSSWSGKRINAISQKSMTRLML